MSNILILTTLPSGIRWRQTAAGIQKPSIRISLVVSPRLDVQGPSSTLAQEDLKDFLDWPARLQGATYNLRITEKAQPTTGQSDAVHKSVVPMNGAAHAADSRYWKTVFAPTTTVKPYSAVSNFMGAGRVTSYDAALLDASIAASYAAQLNPIKRLMKLQPDEVAANPLVRAVSQMLQRKDGKPTVPENLIETSIGNAFERFRAFHERASLEPVSADLVPPQFLEFHEILSALQEHSTFMRKLGLVLDFDIPVDLTQLQILGSEGCVKIEVSGLALSLPVGIFNPWTAFSLTPRVGHTPYGLFHPRRLSGSTTPDWAGFRSLNAGTARITSLEIDAMSTNIIGLAIEANESNQAALDYTARPDPPLHLPAMRGGGFALIDLPNGAGGIVDSGLLNVEKDIIESEDRRRELEEKLRTISALDAGGEEVLYSEDGLVRGYRVDVMDTSKSKWHSLCSRVPSYRFTRAPLKGSALEHWHPGPDEGEVAKVVFYQAAASNSLRVSPYLARWDGWSMVVPRPAKPLNATGKPVKIKTVGKLNFEFFLSVPPKTLVKKRFGRTYKLRVRTVDLAGNAWGVDEATELLSSGLLHVGILEQKNLRLDPVRAPALLEERRGLDGEKGDVLVIRQLDTSGPSESLRHIVPPDVSEYFAEEHGVFDTMSDKNAYAVLTNTEGSFEVGPLSSHRQGTGRLKIPYLPDPLSHMAILKGIPGQMTSRSAKFPSQAGTPAATQRLLLESVILRLLPGAKGAAPAVFAKPGEITVKLPPGHRVSARLCTGFPEDKLDLLWVSQAASRLAETIAILGFEREGLVAPSVLGDELRRSTTQGEESIITPDRDVTFVYATQRPVEGPRFGRHAHVERRLNEVGAELIDHDFYAHVSSTGRIEFTANWEDIIDVPGTPNWVIQRGTLAPFGYELAEDDEPAVGIMGIPASYWRDDPRAGDSAVKKKRKEETKRRQSPTAHSFRDTKYREVIYTARAVSRFASFMPSLIRENIEALSRTEKSHSISVLNSAPPLAPVVRYIVPTFRREKEGNTQRQIGGGIRIYLERPWLSSGRGEKLAVVLYPADLTSAAPELSDFVTQWGFNPRKLGGAVSARPVLEDFEGEHERVVACTMTLYSGQKSDPDLGGNVPQPVTASVSLATYEVHLDGSRDVLYCDLEINPGRAYFPQLRLAIARYQKNSLEGASLSPVVLADFVQLNPERAISVTPGKEGKHKITVTGISYIDVEFGLTTSVIEVFVERRRRAPIGQQPIWEMMPNASTTLQSERIGSETFVWTGEVSEPRGVNWRILLVEYEYYSIDQNAVIRPGEKVVMVGGKKVTRRQIFSDFIEINR